MVEEKLKNFKMVKGYEKEKSADVIEQKEGGYKRRGY